MVLAHLLYRLGARCCSILTNGKTIPVEAAIQFAVTPKEFEVERILSSRQRRRKRRRLSFTIFQQQHPFSCTASIYQTLCEFFSGAAPSHEEAIQLTKCRPDGAELETVVTLLRARCGVKAQTLKSIADVRKSLRAGRPVIADDECSYRDSHAILLVAETPSGVRVLDPNTAEIRWRSDVWLKRSATEFITVFQSSSRRYKPAPRKSNSRS